MNLRVEDAEKNGGSLVTVNLPEDPLGVLPELPKEDLPEDFRKKGFSGSNEMTSGRTGLPESSRNISSGMFSEDVLLPETFRKSVLPDDLSVVPEALSGRPFFRNVSERSTSSESFFFKKNIVFVNCFSLFFISF